MKKVYRPSFDWYAGMAGAGLLTSGTLLYVTVMAREEGSAIAVGGLAAWALIVYFGTRRLAVRLEVDDRGIVVVNELRTHYVRWAEIAGFERSMDSFGAGIAVRLLDGSVIVIRGVPRSNRRDWRVDATLEELEDLLSARARATAD